MAKDKRVEVLFDDTEYKRLEDEAHTRGRSVGWVVREAVAQYVTAPRQAEKGQAIEWLTSQTFEDLGGDWDEVKREIADERARQLEKSLETD